MNPLADLRAMFAAMPGSAPVTFGSRTTRGFLDYDGQAWGAEDQAQVSLDTIALTYCYPDLPGLEPESLLTVNGQAYAVLAGPRRKEDGLMGVVLLKEEA